VGTAMRPMISDMGWGLKPDEQSWIYWNGPFKMQLEPATETGISFRCGNRRRLPGMAWWNQIYGMAIRPSGLAEAEEVQAGGEDDAWPWDIQFRDDASSPSTATNRH